MSVAHPLPQAKKLTQRAAKTGGSIAGYTNDSNPFGDPNLTQRCVLLCHLATARHFERLTAASPASSHSFVWHKKLEKQLVEGADPRELTQKAERQRQAEREVRHTQAATATHAGRLTRCYAQPGGD